MSAIAIPDFYRTWQAQFLQWLPDACDTRMGNLKWLMSEIVKACSVQLSLVARQVTSRAQQLSVANRFEGFLNNPAVRVRPWYRPLAVQLLTAAGSGG
jgi:hypothetical protein